jgi:hypothetical protein
MAEQVGEHPSNTFCPLWIVEVKKSSRDLIAACLQGYHYATSDTILLKLHALRTQKTPDPALAIILCVGGDVHVQTIELSKLQILKGQMSTYTSLVNPLQVGLWTWDSAVQDTFQTCAGLDSLAKLSNFIQVLDLLEGKSPENIW